MHADKSFETEVTKLKFPFLQCCMGLVSQARHILSHSAGCFQSLCANHRSNQHSRMEWVWAVVYSETEFFVTHISVWAWKQIRILLRTVHKTNVSRHILPIKLSQQPKSNLEVGVGGGMPLHPLHAARLCMHLSCSLQRNAFRTPLNSESD